MDGDRSTHRALTRPALALVLMVCAATPGCSPYIGTTASSFLQRARESPDPNIRHLAYARLGTPGCYDSEQQKAEAAQTLSDVLTAGKEPVASRATIARTLGAIGRPEGREALLVAIGDPEPIVRSEACRALGKLGRPEDSVALSRPMTADTDFDCRIAAIEAIGMLKASDPKVLVLLVDGMQSEDPAIRVASLRTLRSITREDFGPELGPWREFADRLARGSTAPASGSDEGGSAVR